MKGELNRIVFLKDPLASSIFLLLMGVVLIVLRMSAVSIIITLVGGVLMVMGSVYLSRGVRSDTSGDTLLGVMGCVLGLLMVIASNLFATVMVYILAAALIVMGVLRIFGRGSSKKARVDIAVGAVLVVLGLLFALFPLTASNIGMVAIGIVLVVISAVGIWNSR